MALIEVEEGEYRKLQSEHANFKPSKAVLDRLGANPKTRGQILRLLKEDNPNLVIPEIDAAAPFVEELGKTKAEIAALQKQIADDKEAAAKTKREADVDGRIDEGRAMLRKLGYNDDGIKGVEELMQKRGNFDYEAAEALFERMNHQPESIIPGSNYGRDSGLFDPPADNPWVDALKWKGSKGAQAKAINRVAHNEINKWFAENRPNSRRVRA